MIATVTRPTSGQKIQAIRGAINLKRIQVNNLTESNRDYWRARNDLAALEAVLLDYQPDNRGRP